MHIDDPKVGDLLKRMNATAFDEDKHVLADQQKMIETDPEGGVLVNLDADKAVSAVRRILRRKLQEETASAV